METTLEVLAARKSGREVHRHWPGEVKAQIVSESLRPAAMVNEVAERHGLKPCLFISAAMSRCETSIPRPTSGYSQLPRGSNILSGEEARQ
ncbi:hypothetical protein CO660_00195 [Rhizobium sp. L9]|uniref:transposase n=1 Tax=Rhizobium sp. L9 TaxID=1340738 RepID=UPI000BE8DC3D|nr:transposase [Rhizobium sp. L9]PDT32293.1 hypothetical protein CO660_00195 [Rhizobium sp. L9]